MSSPVALTLTSLRASPRTHGTHFPARKTAFETGREKDFIIILSKLQKERERERKGAEEEEKRNKTSDIGKGKIIGTKAKECKEKENKEVGKNYK